MNPCTRPFDLDVLDYKATLALVEKELAKALDEKRMLLLRIDQLKWDNERLKDHVEMLTIDLGVKK